jgi:hypothetical protein
VVAGLDGNFDPLFVKAGLYGQGTANVVPYDSNGDGVADTFRLLVDPKTGMPVTTESVGVQLGANQISTIVDGSGKIGASYAGGCVINLFPASITCH